MGWISLPDWRSGPDPGSGVDQLSDGVQFRVGVGPAQ